MREKIQQKIIQNTQENYDIVAQDYTRTRDRSWSAGGFVWDDIVHKIKADDHILDLGAGSGILVAALAELAVPLQYTGYDISPQLLGYAQTRFGTQYRGISCNWQVGDMSDLPFADASFDQVMMIASLHHIPSTKRRLHVLEEVHRVLKPGGYIFMTNWYLWNRVAFSKYKLWKQLANVFHGYDVGDFFIPWQQKQHPIRRYVHSFFAFELDFLLQKSGFELYKKSTLEKRSDASLAQSVVTIGKK